MKLQIWYTTIKQDSLQIGSNNWVVSGSKTKIKIHIWQTILIEKLRYLPWDTFVYLIAPGWNVIGGGEPEIPGISIGHNEHGAWADSF